MLRRSCTRKQRARSSWRCGSTPEAGLVAECASRRSMWCSTRRERSYGPPDLVVEVLSPQPRVGDLERRLAWFASYGVRECWAYHQAEQRLEIVTFVDGAIDQRTFITLDETIDSQCMPEFALILRQVLDR